MDADGNIHFSDRKPAHQKMESVDVDVKNSYEGSEIYQQQKKLFKKYDGDRAAKQEAKTQAKLAKKNMAQRCEIARYKLNRSQTASGVFYVTKDGEREYYNEEQRRLYTKRWRDFIDKKC